MQLGRFDTTIPLAAFASVLLHGAVAVGLAHMPQRLKEGPKVVEFEVRKKPPPPPPPITPPEPPKQPEPPKPVTKVKVKAPPPVAAPPPNQPPPEPPKEPPKPVFGLTDDSTVGDSTFSMPVGNTTMIDPAKSGKHDGKVAPLPAATAPPKPEYKPVSELYVKTMPDIDSEACGRSIQYPQEAEQLGIEGDVKLRVELDERGKVHAIKVLSGLGHGLDQAAEYALKFKCKFSPAIGTDGKPVAFIIPVYLFHFEIPR